MEDPIVAEVHATREKLLAQYGYDLEAMMKAIRESGIGKGHRIIPAPPRRTLIVNPLDESVNDGSIPTTPVVS